MRGAARATGGWSVGLVCVQSIKTIDPARSCGWVGRLPVSVSLQQAAVHAFFASDAFFTHTPQKQAQINCTVHIALIAQLAGIISLSLLYQYAIFHAARCAPWLGWLGAKFDSIPKPLNHSKRTRAWRDWK